jgi:hypothetical protein
MVARGTACFRLVHISIHTYCIDDIYYMRLGSTIAISRSTRDVLKKIGCKGQTYDELIIELIKAKRNRNDSSDSEVSHPLSSESSTK